MIPEIYINNLLNENKKFGVSLVTEEIVKRIKIFSRFNINIIQSSFKTYGNVCYNIFRLLLLEYNILLTKKKNSIFFSPYPELPVLSNMSGVVLFHDIFPIKYPHEYGLLYPKYFKYILLKSLSPQIKIICVSDYTRREIINFAKKQNKKIFNEIEITYNAHDKNFFYCNETNKNHKSNYFLFVGKINKTYKNFQQLINVWDNSELKSKFYIKVAGGINEEYKLDRKYLKKCGYVSKEKLSDLYRNAYALIHPSLDEGFGLTPLEAMACGCPVIVSNRGAIPEVVRDAGIYFDPEDSKSLYEAVSSIVENENIRGKLIKKGIERAKKFDWNITVKKIVSIIEDFFYEKVY